MSANRTNDTVEVPYHGNCPNCHHFHINKPLSIPQDPSTHFRLHCETCNYPILGIGRTSTQTTLASVETQATNQKTQICSNRSGDAAILPILHIEPSPSQELPRSEPLSAITEASSTHHRSRSASGAGSAGATTDHPTGIEASNTATVHQNPIYSEPETRSSVNFVAAPAPNRKESRFVRWRNKAKRVIPARLKALLMARLRTHPRPANNLPELVPEEPTGQIVVEDNASISSASLALQTQVLPPVRSESHNPSPSVAFAAGSPPQDQQQVGNDESSSHRAKREKILTRRRERTAEKQANSIIECECSGNCRCHQQSDRSLSSRNRRENSLHGSDVPSHYLGNLLTGDEPSLAGIGEHLATDRPRTADSDTRDGAVGRSSRLSTATTAQESTSSSLSLDTAGRLQGRSASAAHATAQRQSNR